MKLVAHGLGIRPVFFVKLPVSLSGPVEEINDNDVNMDPQLLVLPCNAKNLLLCSVAQLALPES